MRYEWVAPFICILMKTNPFLATWLQVNSHRNSLVRLNTLHAIPQIPTVAWVLRDAERIAAFPRCASPALGIAFPLSKKKHHYWCGLHLRYYPGDLVWYSLFIQGTEPPLIHCCSISILHCYMLCVHPKPASVPSAAPHSQVRPVIADTSDQATRLAGRIVLS